MAADQAERVILEAEDQVTPIVGKSNAALESFEQKAESSHGKVIRISDQTRTSVQRLITSLEKQAETYGKSGVEKLIAQRDQLLQRYAKEPAAIDAITKSYEKMMATEKQLSAGAGGLQGFGDKVKEFVEHPLDSAKNALQSMASAMGPWGQAIAVGVGIVASIAGAAWESAKALGELGLRVKDVELRTGLTSKEVGQFGFAAKLAGQDVTIFERMMKGLSQATSENSQEGEKAKSTLKALGVELRNTATGELKPTSAMLMEIAEGLGKLPAGVERDAAALNLFKKAGIEAIPVIEKLVDGVGRAKQLGLGMSQKDVDMMVKYHEAIAEVDVWWTRLKRSFQKPLAATIMFFFKDQNGRPVDPQNFRLGPDGTWSRPAPGQYERNRAAAGFEPSQNDIWDRNKQIGDIEDYLHKVDDHQRTLDAQKAYENSQGLQGQLKKAEAALSSMTKPEDATSAKQVADYEKAERQVESLKKQIEGAKHAAEELNAFHRAVAQFGKQTDEAELDAIGKIYHARDLLLKQAKELRVTDAGLLAQIREDADRQVAELNRKEDQARRARSHDTFARAFSDALGNTVAKEDTSDWKAGIATQRRIEDIDLQAQRADLQRRANRAGRMAELSGGTDEEIALQTYQTRVDLALQLAGIEAGRIAKEKDGNEKAVLAAQAQKDLFTALSEAQMQFDEKQQQIQIKRQQELQSQIDGLQKQAERLIDTLFTKPKDFGKDLGNTVRSAVLKPITETLGGAAANFLHPLIYGENGQGGLNGILRGGSGHKDPVVVTEDNTTATRKNTTAIEGFTTFFKEAQKGTSGASAPAVDSASGSPWLSTPASSPASMPSIFSSFGGFPVVGGDGAAAVPYSGGRSSASNSGGFNPLSMVMGGRLEAKDSGPTSLFKPGGFNKALSNLKDSVWNQDAWDSTDSNFWGGVQGAARSPAAGAAGLMLGMNGLTGNRAGTWGGAIEGAAGGALIGNQVAGPFGAAVGASLGFEIGAFEKLFGVKSLPQTAHDDIKSVYGVDIPTNSGTIKQVVSLAQQQFGGSISVAVRSPSVRQLVMLYSEATGQKMPLSATTPYAGSLVEQGGKLYQQASYQDGQAHVYASNIPTLGGINGSAYPTPGGPNTSAGAGGPTYLSLNVDGQGLAPFMTGSYMTPQFVTDQSMAAQNSSYGRTQQAANSVLPGLTVV